MKVVRDPRQSVKSSAEGATPRGRGTERWKKREDDLQRRKDQPRPDQRNLRTGSLRSCTNLIRPMHGMQNDGNCPPVYPSREMESLRGASLPEYQRPDFTVGYLFFRPEC